MIKKCRGGAEVKTQQLSTTMSVAIPRPIGVSNDMPNRHI